jgi:acyl-CoA thioester hydrolase
MLVSETKVRVRYSETDQMGIVYYGNYPQYYEVGRVETLRKLGMTYKEMETKGIFMPITSMSLKYIKPALYDDLLTVKTIITEIPNMRIQFFYEIYNEQGVLLNTGETVLAFVNIETRRPCQAPEWFLSVMKQNWNIDHG